MAQDIVAAYNEAAAEQALQQCLNQGGAQAVSQKRRQDKHDRLLGRLGETLRDTEQLLNELGGE